MAGHLDTLKTELGITDAQEPQWDAFATALRAHVKAMREMRAQMMQQGPAPDWPDRIAQHERRLAAHLEALKAIEAPVRALWDTLSDEQRRKANALLVSHMGKMGRM
ncbi:MAG: Spy/CpxP family protein refolding chaperone [Alphaproteobacteria bacterium]|nr:Spy/CpxP family protein refolding chaperone [Alphaproteobacteria bacterium]